MPRRIPPERTHDTHDHRTNPWARSSRLMSERQIVSPWSRWILNGSDSPLTLNGQPPGSATTYACVIPGHADSDWQTIRSISYDVTHDALVSTRLFRRGSPRGRWLRRSYSRGRCSDSPKVDPDVAAAGSTLVAAFQAGRLHTGASVSLGSWSTAGTSSITRNTTHIGGAGRT